MKRLWSPWRSQHIERMGGDEDPYAGSLFARLAREDRDEANYILWRGAHVFVLMNLYPYNNGHLMIVPYREVDTFEALTPDEHLELSTTIGRCIRWLRAAVRPDGFNVGTNVGEAAGAGYPDHLHLHVVPRWSGDTNFMPVLADVKVIPEAMNDTYRKLKAVIDAEAEEA